MSATPSSLFGRRTPSGGDSTGQPPHRRRHLFLKIFLGVVVFLALLVAGLIWYASTPQFANKVRHIVIEKLEEATGGRVEIGAFRFRLLHLEVEADNLTIHGLEGPGQVPYVHVDRLLIHAKIISLFRAKIGLSYLGVDKPTVHIIIYKNGSTNQPVPKKKSAPLNVNQTINEVFNLEADRAEINDGTFLLNQRKIPFSLAANDLEVGVNYLTKTDQYKASVSIADLTAQRGIAAPIHSKLTLSALMGRNNLSVPDLHFIAGDSTLAMHADVSNFADPHWRMSMKGTVDLREAEALAAIPGLDRGVVGLDFQGKGTKALFSIDGTTTIAGATYKGSGIYIRGLDASTKIHADQDLLAATDLRAHLASGGTLTGDASINHWLAPTAPPAAPSTLAPAAKAEATARAARQVNRAVAHTTSNPPSKAQPSQGKVNIHLQGFTLPSVLSIIAPPKYQHLGFATTASGNVHAAWTGAISNLAAEVKIALNAPAQPAHGDVPVNGTINVNYSGSNDSILVRQLNVQTPGAQLEATGGVGLGAGRHSALQVQASVTDLGEFNKALSVFGVGGKKGAAATLPIALHGHATFNGVVTGSLAAPSVTGHLAVNDFDVLLNSAPAPAAAASAVLPTGPNGQPVPVPAAATTGAHNAAPPPLHIDSLTADFQYSPRMVSVQSAVITRGATQVRLSGQLHAHHTRRKGWVFDDYATVHANASVQDAAIPDLLAIAGESSLPVTGTLNLHTQVGGTLGNLNGGGQLVITGGQIYGEPYKSLNVQLQFAGQNVGASQFALGVAGGQITGNAGYNLKNKQFHFLVQTGGINLDNLRALKKSPLTLHGELALNAQGSGTLKSPTVQAAVHLTRLVIANPAGGPASTGEVDLTAHTQNGALIAQVNARLNGATVVMNTQTTLSGDYATQSAVTLSNLDINPLLGLFNMQGVKGDSLISGSLHVSGPLKQPKQLSGAAQLSRIQITAQGFTLSTQGGLHATLKDGIATLAPLHVTGTGTDVTVQGQAALFGTNRLLNAKADGTLDLKVAHSFVPDIDSSGTVDFHFTAANTIERPDLEGAVTFHEVNVAYADFPNGLNHLNGSLVFDQGRLSVKDLHATSGGGNITFGGFITYQQGVYANLTINAAQVRIRYPAGVSTMIDSKIRVQGTLQSLLVSGGVNITRFTIFPDVDLSSFSSNGISPPPDPTAFANRIRLDVHVTSAEQLDITNSYAKLAGNVDLYVRGTAEDPSILGHIGITEGEATFAGTHYVLQHGDIYFTNPVEIEPTIDLEASAHVEDYNIIIGVHGTPDHLEPTFRSEPPLSEQDIFSLLALGRTQEESAIYSQQQSQAGVNSTADTLLGGALNATLSSRINKLFGGGSVKIDPTFVSGTGNSTARITVQQQIGKNFTVTYATNVNSTAEQLIQGQYNITENVSVVAVRDESGVFSLELKLHRRYR